MATPQPPHDAPEGTPGHGTGWSRRRLADAIRDAYDLWCRRLVILVRRRQGPASYGQLREQVQELAGEVTRRVLERPEAYDSRRPLVPWLMGIAFNVLRERRRESRRDPQRIQTDLDNAVWSAAMETLLALGDVPETPRMAKIRRALARLGDDERRILVLRYGDDLDGDDLARAVGAPSAGAARTRLARAKRRLHDYVLADREEETP